MPRHRPDHLTSKRTIPVYPLTKQQWTLTDDSPKNGDYGCCHFDKRQIDVRTNKRTKEEQISTILHETIHAVCPWLTEEAVLNLELAQMRVLKAYGMFTEED